MKSIWLQMPLLALKSGEEQCPSSVSARLGARCRWSPSPCSIAAQNSYTTQCQAREHRHACSRHSPHHTHTHAWQGRNTGDSDCLSKGPLPDLIICRFRSIQMLVSLISGTVSCLWDPWLQGHNPIQRPVWCISPWDTLIPDMSILPGYTSSHPDTLSLRLTLFSIIYLKHLTWWSQTTADPKSPVPESGIPG